jgi:hypothetical protein
MIEVSDPFGFDHLEHQPARIETELARPADRALQAVHRVVDGGRDEVDEKLSLESLSRRTAQRRFARLPVDLKQQIVFAGQREDLVWEHQTAVGSPPAQQRFVTGHGPIGRRQDRLEPGDEALGFQDLDQTAGIDQTQPLFQGARAGEGVEIQRLARLQQQRRKSAPFE